MLPSLRAFLFASATLATSWIAFRGFHPFLKESGTRSACVVLGHALDGDGAPSGRLRCRVHVGLELWRSGVVEGILFSGGHPGSGKRGGFSEAEAMARYAMDEAGLSERPSSWRLEQDSTSTRENALLSLDLVHKEGWESLLIVTNRFHQERALRTFRKAASDRGMNVTIDLADGLDPCEEELERDWIRSVEAILLNARERAATVYYRARGWT